MSSVAYSSYEQGQEIPAFRAMADLVRNDDLISVATQVQNGCCRGLSMKWLERGCTAAGMSIFDPGITGLVVMAEAARLQTAGESGDTDLASQLKQLGLPPVGRPGIFSEVDKVRKALTFVNNAKGRYFIGIGEPPQGHAIAALYNPPASRVFDPNAGELTLDNAEFETWLKVVLKHYVAKGYGTILIFYLGPIPGAAAPPALIPASAASASVPTPPTTPSPRAGMRSAATPSAIPSFVPTPPSTPSPRAVVAPWSASEPASASANREGFLSGNSGSPIRRFKSLFSRKTN